MIGDAGLKGDAGIIGPRGVPGAEGPRGKRYSALNYFNK